MPCYRFHGELNQLLPADLRNRAFQRGGVDHATVKHAVEALGVPHTEVGAILINGRAAEADQQLSSSDRVEVHPATFADSGECSRPRFFADAHLGGLARRLRLLGFDTVLASDAPDHLLAELAERDDRIVLSRDRELLKHRRVRCGRFVRALRTDEQMHEIATRFGLQACLRPFTRCLECNSELREAGASEVADRVPPRVAARHERFTVCPGCGRVYWPGSHWQRLQAVVEATRACGNLDGRLAGGQGGADGDDLLVRRFESDGREETSMKRTKRTKTG